MKNARLFLRLLTERVPPTAPARHSLTLHDVGLCASLNTNGKFYDFFLDETDVDRPVEDLIAEIVGLLSRAETCIV